MQTAEPQFPWLREFVIPALFIVIGAMVGFVVSFFVNWMSDELKAIEARKSFVRAIGLELDALGDQLNGSRKEVRGSIERVRERGTGPQFAAALRTSVFASQVGKLRDVDDPLIVAVIHFYSDMGTLQQMFSSANDLGAEYNFAELSKQQDRVRPLLQSTLFELELQIGGFVRRLRELRAELLLAEQLDGKTTLWNLIKRKLEKIIADLNQKQIPTAPQ